MSNGVDKLFKEKLTGYATPPSPNAWGKVEAHLTKKNKSVIWFRAAAVFALMGLLTFVWFGKNREEAPQIAETSPIKAETKSPVVKPSAEKSNMVQQQKPNKKSNGAKRPKQNLLQPESIESAIVTTPVEQNRMALQEINRSESITPKEVNTSAQVVVAEKSIKLTFTLPSLPSEEATIASTEEKRTTLQKAVETANEIRTGDVLGSLRDAKNDLFALEFKKDKSKKQ